MKMWILLTSSIRNAGNSEENIHTDLGLKRLTQKQMDKWSPEVGMNKNQCGAGKIMKGINYINSILMLTEKERW